MYFGKVLITMKVKRVIAAVFATAMIMATAVNVSATDNIEKKSLTKLI